MNEKILGKLSPSARKALAALARKPEDAAHFHDRLSIVHAALMIGREVIEEAIKEKPDDPHTPVKAAAVTGVLSITMALEITMDLLRRLYPNELGVTNRSRPPENTTFPDDPGQKNRLRKLDLD